MKKSISSPRFKKTLALKVINSYKKNFGIARCNLELMLQEHKFTSFNTALFEKHID